MENTLLHTDLLTISDTCQLFGVKQMAIWNWRRKENDPLPCIVIPGNARNTIRLKFDDVVAWGKRNDKAMPGLVKARQEINARVASQSVTNSTAPAA